MAGIIFFTTSDLEKIVNFYTKILGCRKWISQPNVEILSHGNLLLGFHMTGKITGDTLTTFFYKSKEQVDYMYQIMIRENLDPTKPQENETYKIYNFFAKDIEGRKLEFQSFLHEVPHITIYPDFEDFN